MTIQLTKYRIQVGVTSIHEADVIPNLIFFSGILYFEKFFFISRILTSFCHFFTIIILIDNFVCSATFIINKIMYLNYYSGSNPIKELAESNKVTINALPEFPEFLRGKKNSFI